ANQLLGGPSRHLLTKRLAHPVAAITLLPYPDHVHHLHQGIIISTLQKAQKTHAKRVPKCAGRSDDLRRRRTRDSRTERDAHSLEDISVISQVRHSGEVADGATARFHELGKNRE